MNETKQIADFIQEHGITLHVISGPTGAVDKDGENEWPHVAWIVELRTASGATIKTPWKAGIGHYKPSADVVRQAERIASWMGSSIIRKKHDDKTESVFNVTDNHALAIMAIAKPLGTRYPRARHIQAEAAAMVAKLQRITPDAGDVLDSLRMDASTPEHCPTFRDFCADYGYDEDSRKAEQTYRACMESAARMQSWLGLRALADLIECEGL